MIYRNWKAITDSSQIDPYMTRALALLNLDSPLGREFVNRFPEWFSTTPLEDAGPIPLSVIRTTACRLDGMERAADFPFSCGATVELGIPTLQFALNSHTEREWGIPLIPPELKEVKQQGTTINHGVETFVCLEYNTNSGVGIVYFAPLIYVDPTS
ncbi:hypothetical protein HY734_01010 [Candidatus Uhrbacteria bacterium]|nr:hypothetical protein [Candidatus Uhrbacteria bacterium]